ASQPWPFPSSLMLGFIAEAEPDVPRPSDEELEDARWFTREEVGDALEGRTREQGLLLSPRLSISRWLVEYWHRGGAACARTRPRGGPRSPRTAAPPGIGPCPRPCPRSWWRWCSGTWRAS